MQNRDAIATQRRDRRLPLHDHLSPNPIEQSREPTVAVRARIQAPVRRVRGSNGLRAFILTGGVALHAVSIYVVATIMPVVVGDIGGLAFFAWTATLYVAASLCSASAVPLLLSRRRLHVVYRFAFGLFLTGSLVCSLAPTMGLLLLGRLLQGLGGGMLPALAYATIKETFPASLHARAIALIGSVWGVAALIGPSIGGVFAELGAWRAAFWIDVVIGLSSHRNAHCLA